MKTLLPNYYQYMRTTPNNLISKFYGFYSIQANSESIAENFIVMDNVFSNQPIIHEVFDLKGSTHNRSVPMEQKTRGSVVLKDLDISRGSIRLKPEDKKSFEAQLVHDCNFLEANNMMDYSLLVGIHHIQSNENEIITQTFNLGQSCFHKNNGGLLSSDGSSIYYFGIIDILTPYGLTKILESSWKSLFVEESTLSAVNPHLYSTRFQHYILTYCMDDVDHDVCT